MKLVCFIALIVSVEQLRLLLKLFLSTGFISTEKYKIPSKIETTHKKSSEQGAKTKKRSVTVVIKYDIKNFSVLITKNF